MTSAQSTSTGKTDHLDPSGMRWYPLVTRTNDSYVLSGSNDHHSRKRLRSGHRYRPTDVRCGFTCFER